MPLAVGRPQPSDIPHLAAPLAAPVGRRVRLHARRHDLRRAAERARGRRRRRRRVVNLPVRSHALPASGASAGFGAAARPALTRLCTRWRRSILRLRSFWNRARSPLRRDMGATFLCAGCGGVRSDERLQLYTIGPLFTSRQPTGRRRVTVGQWPTTRRKRRTRSSAPSVDVRSSAPAIACFPRSNARYAENFPISAPAARAPAAAARTIRAPGRPVRALSCRWSRAVPSPRPLRALASA